MPEKHRPEPRTAFLENAACSRYLIYLPLFFLCVQTKYSKKKNAVRKKNKHENNKKRVADLFLVLHTIK